MKGCRHWVEGLDSKCHLTGKDHCCFSYELGCFPEGGRIYSNEIQDELYLSLKRIITRLDAGLALGEKLDIGWGREALAKAEKEDTEWTKNIAQY